MGSQIKMMSETRKKIEHYLYNYDYIDIKINNIMSNISDSEYNNSYIRWIKNKSSSLEDQVIRNINLERRILKLKKWKNLITAILKKYNETNKLKYHYIKLKYFCRASPLTIQAKLNLSIKEQKDIQAEILQYIFFVAIKKGILKEVIS